MLNCSNDFKNQGDMESIYMSSSETLKCICHNISCAKINTVMFLISPHRCPTSLYMNTIVEFFRICIKILSFSCTCLILKNIRIKEKDIEERKSLHTGKKYFWVDTIRIFTLCMLDGIQANYKCTTKRYVLSVFSKWKIFLFRNNTGFYLTGIWLSKFKS